MATRDYKHAGKKKGQTPLPGWVWLFSGLAIGLFVALLVYLDKQPTNTTQVAVTPSVTVIKDGQDVREVRSATGDPIPAPERPKFDFYTLLPELEVVVPDDQYSSSGSSNTTSGGTQAQTQPSIAVENGQFLLQAGSFRKLEEADRLKANLALLGVQAHIQAVKVDSDTWHRVRIGPIASLSEINDIRARLKSNDIETMLLKVR